MITLSMIETLIRDNQTELKADVAHFKSIIEANESLTEPESIYLNETAKEKSAESLQRQSEPVPYILREALSSLNHKRKTSDIEKEIRKMENYAGYTEDEKEELNALKIFEFTIDQDILIIEFLIDQFVKQEVFLRTLEK